jgi:hypothetical protein
LHLPDLILGPLEAAPIRCLVLEDQMGMRMSPVVMANHDEGNICGIGASKFLGHVHQSPEHAPALIDIATILC